MCYYKCNCQLWLNLGLRDRHTVRHIKGSLSVTRPISVTCNVVLFNKERNTEKRIGEQMFDNDFFLALIKKTNSLNTTIVRK